jgi:hypothetical protein
MTRLAILESVNAPLCSRRKSPVTHKSKLHGACPSFVLWTWVLLTMYLKSEIFDLEELSRRHERSVT